MIHQLHHFNKATDFVSGFSLVLLWSTPHIYCTFSLVRMMRAAWPRLSAWKGMTLIFCVVFNLRGMACEGSMVLTLLSPFCFPTPWWSRQFNVGRFFVSRLRPVLLCPSPFCYGSKSWVLGFLTTYLSDMHRVIPTFYHFFWEKCHPNKAFP